MWIEEEAAGIIDKSGARSLLVAVSGGADSVALLCVCTRMSCRHNLHVEAVNCNFHLRGEESDRDSEFVADLCRKLGIRLHTLDYDVEQYMADNPGSSMEMACRNLRYADFFRLRETHGFDRIAVAHNADDDIETMMLNMLRGSGTRGLRGMDADNGRVIRPLLNVSRIEIEEYLKEIGQGFITDSSNLSSDYRRNFLRRDIIPLLETRWPGIKKSLSRTLSIMKEESGIVENHYRDMLARYSPHPLTLLIYEEGLTPGIIYRFISQFGGNSTIAASIMESIGKDFSERKWKLSERYTAILERDRLIVIDEEVITKDPMLQWQHIEMNAATMAEIKKNRSHDVIYLPENASAYELRRPRRGDRMSPLGMKGTRLVSDIISDARLSHERKGKIRVLTRRHDGEIIWVTGLKRSRHDLLNPDCTSAYRVVYSFV